MVGKYPYPNQYPVDLAVAAAADLNPKPETRIRKPETRIPKTESRIPKPETRNPKPQLSAQLAAMEARLRGEVSEYIADQVPFTTHSVEFEG